MSEFVILLLKNSFFLSILTQGNLEVLNDSALPTISKYSEDAYTFNNFSLLDSIKFEQVSIVKIPKGFSFSFFARDTILLTNSDYYFDSSNNNRKKLDKMYTSSGYSRRKYSDKVAEYTIYITVRSLDEKCLVNLILEKY